MKRPFLVLILLLVIMALFAPAIEVEAFSLMDGVGSKCWAEDGSGTGDCSVCDILRVFYNVGRFIFMSMSGVALILIIFASIKLIFNWGSAEGVASAKKIILHSILGVVIILLAWTLVNVIGFEFLGAHVTLEEFWKAKNWYTGPTCN